MSALFLCRNAGAVAGGQLIFDNYLPIPPAASYSSTFSIRADGIDWAAAQIVVTSVTQPAQTFTDGQASTANLTVVSFAALSTAAATGSITVNSNTGLTNACISGGGPNAGSFNACNPGNWAIGNTSSNTACNIAAAIQSFGIILSTCGTNNGSVVYDSAPVGTANYNAFQISVSTAGALLVPNLISSSPITNIGIGTLSGGQNDAVVTFGGVTLTANNQWFPVTSNNQTATNLAAAIAANVPGVTAGATGAVVFATGTAVGTTFTITTSTQAALTLAPFTSSSPVTGIATGNTAGASNAGYVLNTSTITLPGNNFGLAEGVYISTTGNVIPAPLVWGTTYYVIPVPAFNASAVPNINYGPSNTIELATSQANALANTPIVLSSSQTKTTADTFTLTVSGITGSPGVDWVASNDNVHWVPYVLTPFNVTISSVTYGSFVSSGTVNNFDFGHYNYSYIGLNVTPPTAGAININAHVIGNAP